MGFVLEVLIGLLALVVLVLVVSVGVVLVFVVIVLVMLGWVVVLVLFCACFSGVKGGTTLQLSWTSKINPWALTLFLK